MSTAWQREAQGIQPWAGALFFAPDGSYVRVLDVDGERVAWFDENTKVVYSGLWLSHYAPALEDPDTLAAFDWRLALRLGATEEAVREGVLFYRYNGVWILSAGNPERYWWRNSNDGRFGEDATDPLLARVRAWNSVKETS